MKVSKNLPHEIQECIDRLENAGYKVRMQHTKFTNPIMIGSKCRATAQTIMSLENENKSVFASGHAFCSQADVFSRATGAKLAFGRMVNNLSRRLGRPKVKKILEANHA